MTRLLQSGGQIANSSRFECAGEPAVFSLRLLRALLGGAVVLYCASETATAAQQASSDCNVDAKYQLVVDQGHDWRPPFGVDRVGALPKVSITVTGMQSPATTTHVLVTYRAGQVAERIPIRLRPSQLAAQDYQLFAQEKAPTTDQLPHYAHLSLRHIPDELAIEAHCIGGSRAQERLRQLVEWPIFEAKAVARPANRVNPVDLGAVLPPGDWLLLGPDRKAVIEVAALSRKQSVPGAQVKAWFAGEKPVQRKLVLKRDERSAARLELPFQGNSSNSLLHISILDHERELWRTTINTLLIKERATLPTFGAIETKLRYEGPVHVNDVATGESLPAIDYSSAWPSELNDVVVALPTGERFVFWRGASYAPFWAGSSNTGVGYQWAEAITPPGFTDAVEPTQDKELRFSRVEIVESTRARVHVRWSYQPIDVNYQQTGDQVVEDFYFYPDGFGTRVVTVASAQPAQYAYSEFMTILPAGKRPFEAVAQPEIDLIDKAGVVKTLRFPLSQRLPLRSSAAQASTDKPLLQAEISLSQRVAARVEQGKKREPLERMWNAFLTRIEEDVEGAVFYRLRTNDESASAIYYSTAAARPILAFLPFEDRGETVTPSYWGHHWPMSRGRRTGGSIADHINASPSHFSFLNISDPEPTQSSRRVMPDALGRVHEMALQERVWLIGKTALPVEDLKKWAASFDLPPSLALTGASAAAPGYAQERRASRLIVEQPAVTIAIKPEHHMMNPVFELEQVPTKIRSISIDGRKLTPTEFAWDGSTLWIQAAIDSRGATLTLDFDPASRQEGLQ